MNTLTTLNVTFYLLLFTGSINFILSIYIRKFKKKDTNSNKLIIKQTKGYLFNWMKNHLNEKGVKVVKWIKFLFLIFIFELILFLFQIVLITLK